jgi:hypothetical protein
MSATRKGQRMSKRHVLNTEGALPQDTLLAANAMNILITADSMRSIANLVTKQINRKLTTGEIGQLDTFIKRLPDSQFAGMQLSSAHQKIANDFIHRFQMWDEVAEEQEDLAALTRIKEQTNEPTYVDAMKAELGALSDNENSLKYSIFHDRKGRSIVSKERAGKERIFRDRSTPDNYLNAEGQDWKTAEAGYAPAGEGMKDPSTGADVPVDAATMAAAFRNQVRVNKELMKYLKMWNGLFNPETIDEIFARSTSSLMTFGSVVMPHQVVPLDTRFRLIDYMPPVPNTAYRWYVHTANDAGRPGDIRTQDTLTQVMSMTIDPFWIPVSNARYQYYQRIRMYIHEFKSQAVQVNEFVDGDSGTMTRTNFYHFEFLVDRVGVDRIHLTPINPTYIFRMPIAQVNTLTVSFRSPFELIVFDPDRLNFLISNTNPAVFTSLQPNNLATGDLVYVTNFTVMGFPNEVALVNQSAGWFITRLSATTFSIPVDLSALPGPVPNIEVQFGSKRIVTQIEFQSLEQ